MKFAKYIVILVLFTLTSCITNRLIFQEKKEGYFERLDIEIVVKLEKQKHSKDTTPDHLIEIGEGIYPNKNNFVLATPKTFRIKEKPYFTLETEYFYTVNDSSVKAIVYQWDYLKKKKAALLEEDHPKKFKVFKTKFDELTSQLTEEFGEPVLKNIDHARIKDDSFRDDLKFKRGDGLNAYLFMFGNKNGYRQIRLAIYKN